MSDTIILQRVIPHYRAPLFEALHERFGWVTVAASNPPGGTFLNTNAAEASHIRLFPFTFSSAERPWECKLPLDRIVAELKPRRIISEFSMRMNVGRSLPRLRAQRRIECYALWSHGWNMDRGFAGPADWLSNAARLLPLSMADTLLTYGEEGRAWLKRWLPWKDVVAIGNTIDVDPMRKAGAVASALTNGNPQLLSVGRLTHDKRFDRLIRIFAEVKTRLPKAALTIVGDGPERARLEALGQRIGGVLFTGALYDEAALAPHFKGADFLVLPGAAGLSVNHALAYGLPVLAYRRGPKGPFHHPEIEYVQESVTGLFAADHSDEAMAGLIVEAHEQGRAAALRRTIGPYVDTRLRLENMVERFAQVDAAL